MHARSFPSLLVALCLVACVPRGHNPKAPDTFLWAITTSPGAEPVAWLLGSVHVARQGDGIDRAALDAYDRSDTLAVELDLDAVDIGALSRVITTTGRYEPGHTLSEALGAEDFDRLSRLMGDAGLDAPDLDTWRPWLVALVLGFVPLAGDKRGGASGGLSTGVDQYFLDRARGQRPIVALETIDEQVDALSSASDAVQLLELRGVLDALERGESPVDQVLDSYMAGDSAALEDQVVQAGADAERRAWLDRVFRDRNALMAERAAVMIRGGTRPFIVVGAGHLVGPDRLQVILEREGFRLTAVPPTGVRVPLVPPKVGAPIAPRVSGHRVAWPCDDASVSERDASGGNPPTQTCEDGTVFYMLSSVALPSGIGGMLSDEQFFGLQIAQLKAELSDGEVKHGPSTVGTLTATGAPLAVTVPAYHYGFRTDDTSVVGVIAKVEDLVFSFTAYVTGDSEDVKRAVDTLSSFVLVLSHE